MASCWAVAWPGSGTPTLSVLGAGLDALGSCGAESAVWALRVQPERGGRVVCVSVLARDGVWQGHRYVDGVVLQTATDEARVTWACERLDARTVAITLTPLWRPPLWGLRGVAVLALERGRLRVVLRDVGGGPGAVAGAALSPGATLAWSTHGAAALVTERSARPLAGLDGAVAHALALPHLDVFVVASSGGVSLVRDGRVTDHVRVAGVARLHVLSARALAAVSRDGTFVCVLRIGAAVVLLRDASPVVAATLDRSLLACAAPWLELRCAAPGAVYAALFCVCADAETLPVLGWRGSVWCLDAARPALLCHPLPPHAQPAPLPTCLAAHEVLLQRRATDTRRRDADHIADTDDDDDVCGCDAALLLCARVRATRRLDCDPHWARLLPRPPWLRCAGLGATLAALLLPVLAGDVRAPAAAELLAMQVALGRYDDAAHTLRFALAGDDDAAAAALAVLAPHWRRMVSDGRPATMLSAARRMGSGALAAALRDTRPLAGQWGTTAQLQMQLALPEPRVTATSLSLALDRRAARLLGDAAAAAGPVWALLLRTLLLDAPAVRVALAAVDAAVRDEWLAAAPPWNVFVDAVQNAAGH